MRKRKASDPDQRKEEIIYGAGEIHSDGKHDGADCDCNFIHVDPADCHTAKDKKIEKTIRKGTEKQDERSFVGHAWKG